VPNPTVDAGNHNDREIEVRDCARHRRSVSIFVEH
jgi:hypothetical protein